MTSLEVPLGYNQSNLWRPPSCDPATSVAPYIPTCLPYKPANYHGHHHYHGRALTCSYIT